jgi:hypothetical protein
MLRDRHEVDKLFEMVIQLVPPMNAELTRIDQYVDDEVLYRSVRTEIV